jgi:hypothetical protein
MLLLLILLALATTAANTSRWTLESGKSRFTSGPSAAMRVVASGDESDFRPALNVGCADGIAVAWIDLGYPPAVEESPDTATLLLRFDDGPVEKNRATPFERRSTVSLMDPTGLMARLGKHKTLAIRASLFGIGPQEAEFDVRGFDAAALDAACGWTK